MNTLAPWPPAWAGESVQGWQDRALELGWPEPETSPDGALAGHLGALESDLAQTRVERHRRGRELYEGVGRPLVVLAVRAEVILYRDASGQVCALGHPERALGLSAASWARDLGIPEHIDPPRPPGLPSSAQLRAAQKGTKTLWKRERFGPTDELGTLAARTSPKDELGSFETAPEHRCHAKGCHARVEPRLLMCPRHWRAVPANLQADVWRTYRAGQEIDKSPTREYLAAARAAIEAVAAKERPQATPAPTAAPTSAPTELLWIDTETTGRSASVNQIVEVAIAITSMDGEVLLEPRSVLVAIEPWSKNELETIGIHGIDWRTPEFKRSAKPLREVVERVCARTEGRRIAGHNVAFDVGFVKASAERVGLPVRPELAAPTLDTLTHARALKKRGLLHVDSCSLVALRERFGVGHTAHRAAGDVAATIEIYRRLRALETPALAASA
jgi:DNA polymerase III epsilon subunit-like protein